MAVHLIEHHHVVHPGLRHHPHALVVGQLSGRLTEPRLIFDRSIPGVLLGHLLPYLVVSQLSHWQTFAGRRHSGLVELPILLCRQMPPLLPLEVL
jgi:hypothetical protein